LRRATKGGRKDPAFPRGRERRPAISAAGAGQKLPGSGYNLPGN